MINDLWRAGMVEYSKKVDNTNLRVTAVCDGVYYATITDFRNLGNQYMQYINNGEGYFNCEMCGITLKQRSGKQKYCDVCASEVNRSMTKDRKMLRNMNDAIFERFDFDDTATPG